jgi:hypothetical protein
MSAILGAHTSDRSQKPASAQLSLPSGAATTEEEEEEERGDRRMAVPIDGSMTRRQVDDEVKRFVMGPGRRLLSTTIPPLVHARAVRCTRSGQYNATVRLTCAKPGSGTDGAPSDDGSHGSHSTAQVRGAEGKSNAKEGGSGEEESNSTVPRAIIDYPPLNKCPPYPAPPHGSVWYKGVEYKTLTPAGIREIPALVDQSSIFWIGLWCKDDLPEFQTIAIPSQNPRNSIPAPNFMVSNTLNAPISCFSTL